MNVFCVYFFSIAPTNNVNAAAVKELQENIREIDAIVDKALGMFIKGREGKF